jgi:hypothetical protein
LCFQSFWLFAEERLADHTGSTAVEDYGVSNARVDAEKCLFGGKGVEFIDLCLMICNTSGGVELIAF